MASAASLATFPGWVPVPPSDPQAIRACLTPTLAAEFDREREIVLERVKQSIMRTGGNPDAVPFEEMQALIRQRQIR